MPRPLPAVAALLLSFVAIAQESRLPEAFQLGLGLQQRGLHEEAAAQFAAFLQQNGRHALAREAHYRRGTSLLQLGQRDPGIAALQQAVRGNAAEFALRHEARYRLASAQKEGGDANNAAQELGRMLADLPADHYLAAGAHYALGECHRDLGKDDAALPCFEAAAQRATGDSKAFAFPAHYQAGFGLLRLQRQKDAAAQFAAAVAAATDAAQKHECEFLAGDAALRAGDLDAADRWLAAAQQGDGEFADDADLGAAFVLIARGNGKAARERLERFLQRRAASPLRERAQLELGRAAYQQQDYGKAEAALQPLAQSADATVQRPAKELLGLCALATGRGEVAVEPLRQALATAAAADKPRLSFALAEALADAGKYEEALPAYAEAQHSADPGLRGDALYGACFALHQLGRFDDSTARAETLRQELPQHRLVAMAVFATAENRFAQRRYEEAQRDYAAVPRGGDTGPQGGDTASKADFKLAWCRYLLGDKKSAATRFLAQAEQPGDAHREEALSMAALALLESGDGDRALALADAYRVRFPKGLFLDRTERIAARVLRARGDLLGAGKRLQNASAVAKDGGADVLERAELDFQRGDFAAAQAAFAGLGDRPDAVGARALEGLAWCAFELGDDAACADRLQQAMGHKEGAGVRPALLELTSALHHRQQQWPAAIATAQRFLQEYPQHEKAPALRHALGLAQARAGQQQAARATFTAVITDGKHDRLDRAHYELGWACRRDGDEAAALRAFAAVVATSKDEDLLGEARLHLGTAQLQQGDVEGARQHLLAARGRFRGRALYQIAFHDFEQSEQKPQLLPRAEQAFTELSKLANEPLVPEALFLCGECRRRAGDHAGSKAPWLALLQQSPQHERAPLTRLGLAEAAAATGDGELAVAQGQQFLADGKREPKEQARAHLAIGRGRQLRAEHERAEQAFAKVTGLSDGQLAAEAQFRIGETRQAAGNLQGAVDAFVKLPILYAHAEWVQKGLLQAGLCCEQLAQPEKARRFFAELVQRFPQSAEAKTAQSRLEQKQ